MNEDRFNETIEEATNGFDHWREHTLRRHDGLAQADRAIRAFIVERPFAAVGLALAAGYIVARSINAVR